MAIGRQGLRGGSVRTDCEDPETVDSMHTASPKVGESATLRGQHPIGTHSHREIAPTGPGGEETRRHAPFRADVLSSADIDVIRAFAMTAASPVQDTGTVVTAGAAVHGTTRAQVRAELLQAEETGLIPADKIHYPPDAQTRARNRAQFQQAENWWRAHGQLNPSMQ